MREFSPQEIALLRDSQINAYASFGVFGAVWLILQGVLVLSGADMPGVQFFDPNGNFSWPGILITFVFLGSALLPHRILLWRYRLSWREGARLVRDFNEGLHESLDAEWVRRAPRPAAHSEPPEYWQERWDDFLAGRDDDQGTHT